MSVNVHPNSCPVFPYLVCAGNLTWRGRSGNAAHALIEFIQSAHYSPLLDLELLAALTPGATLSAFFGDATPTSTVTSSLDSSSWYTSTAQSGLLLQMQHSHPTLAFKPFILFPPTLYLLPLHLHHRLMLLAVSVYLLLPLFLPDSLKVLQWNAGGLQARSTELLHFISSPPIDLICIQESNLNLSSSFRIPGFSALRSDGTHSRSGIFSTDVTDANGSVIIFVTQGLSFSELSTSSLSSLNPYSDYVKVNISLKSKRLLLALIS